jgi:hypothetical protein
MRYTVAAGVLALVPVCLLVAGCSGEPSEADIQQVYEVEIDRANEQMVRMGGEQAANLLGKTELHSVEKLGCKEAEGNSGYNCDVKVDISVPFLGRQTQTRSQRFVEGDDGWVVISR